MSESPTRLSRSVHARSSAATPQQELDKAECFRQQYSPDALVELYGQHVYGMSDDDAMMRRVLWRALAKSCGTNLRVGVGAIFRNIERFELGDHIYVGPQSYIQGCHDGICRLGDRLWLGPQSYLDARDLVMGDDVGWGPGARLLGSQHTGLPADVPIIHTDLEIKPVRIENGADVGTSAVVMPGVTIGEGAIVGAGGVVTHDVAPYSVVVGVPAKFLRWRDGHMP